MSVDLFFAEALLHVRLRAFVPTLSTSCLSDDLRLNIADQFSCNTPLATSASILSMPKPSQVVAAFVDRVLRIEGSLA